MDGLDGKSYNSIHLRSAAKCLPHFRTCPSWRSLYLPLMSEMSDQYFPYKPPLRPEEDLQAPGKQPGSSFRALSRISPTLSPHLLPQMCGPEGN